MNSTKNSPKNSKSPRQTARIIWAIVVKDILEALKNKKHRRHYRDHLTNGRFLLLHANSGDQG